MRISNLKKTLVDIKRIFIEGSFKTVETEYDKEYVQEINSFNQRDQYHQELKRIVGAAGIDEDDYVLDFGCNTGYAMEVVKRMTGCDVRGVEQNQHAVEHALNERPTLDIDHYEGRELPYESSSFDVCMMNHVIGHLPDPVGSLSEVRRVLTDNGKVCIVTPNKYYKIGMIIPNIFNNYEPDPTVLRYYSRREIIKDILQAEFRISHIEMMGEHVPWLQEAGLESVRLRIFVIAT